MYQEQEYVISPRIIVDRLLRGFEANIGPYPRPEKLILTKWTEAVKTVLQDVGKKLEAEEVFCSGCGQNYSEYLWMSSGSILLRPDQTLFLNASGVMSHASGTT